MGKVHLSMPKVWLYSLFACSTKHQQCSTFLKSSLLSEIKPSKEKTVSTSIYQPRGFHISMRQNSDLKKTKHLYKTPKVHTDVIKKMFS